MDTAARSTAQPTTEQVAPRVRVVQNTVAVGGVPLFLHIQILDQCFHAWAGTSNVLENMALGMVGKVLLVVSSRTH